MFDGQLSETQQQRGLYPTNITGEHEDALQAFRDALTSYAWKMQAISIESDTPSVRRRLRLDGLQMVRRDLARPGWDLADALDHLECVADRMVENVEAPHLAGL